MCVVMGTARTANENKSYLCSCFFENSVIKDPDRRKPWKRDREKSQGYMEVDTGFIMPFRFETLSAKGGAGSIDIL